MDTWAEIRRRIASGELSLRQAARLYHLNFRTVRKVVQQHDPPSSQAIKPRTKPVLGPFLPLVHQILEEDRHAPPKQPLPDASTTASKTSTATKAAPASFAPLSPPGSRSTPRPSCRSSTRPARPSATSAEPPSLSPESGTKPPGSC